MKIQIKITKEVLERSSMCERPGESREARVGQNCAIGKAIVDLFGSKTWVSKDVIHFYKNGNPIDDYGYFNIYSDFRIILPKKATDFINAFDDKTPLERILMHELSFEIEVPNEVIDLIGIGQVYKVLSESKTLQLSEI